MQSDCSTDLVWVKEVVDGIPILACFEQDGRRKPLVILSHGFRGNKESWRPHLQSLAEQGYYAVALDNRSHGERTEPDFASQVFRGERLKVHEVRRLIKETAEDVSRLIDHFVLAEEVDPQRIGMAGVSMGGFTTFRALVIEDRITVAAPIIASPYWDDIPQGVPIAEEAEDRQALERISRECSPALFPERFPPRPLLIQIGGEDGHYDGARVIAFAEQLRGYYRPADADRVALVVHKGVGHELTPDMWANALGWFGKHL
jgi:pimeloyl-ACP methyl ester carboxylesterase